MASVTRSTRRAEGLHPHHHSHHLTSSTAGAGLFHQASSRNKRTLETADHDFDVIKPKRARIAVEILAKGSQNLSDAVKVSPAAAPRPRPAIATVNPPPHTTTTPAPPPAATHVPKNDQNLTKHQAKVINGIKHELGRLQPQPADARDQGRKLRSQEATRFKSELSAYFPEYDEVIGNEPKEQYLLNIDTPIVVIDSFDSKRAAANPQRAAQRPHQYSDQYTARGYGDALFSDLFDAQRIDFSFLEAQFKNKALEDPLPDKLFQPTHRRAERHERSIRNTEKGRAQHEKDQIIRLLEGLQGHDWLRVMGVSGITETKKRSFEPARDHFIKGCQAILDKFRNWILEEKRRKQEKEKALAERAEDEESGSAKAEDESDDELCRDETSDLELPTKQLREEATTKSKTSTKNSKKQRPTPQPPSKAPAPKSTGSKATSSKAPVSKPPAPKAVPAKPLKPPKPPEPPKEFKSFFSKRYERDGALNRHRRAGRKVMAWGHVIPEIPQLDFALPEEYRDSETMKARERRKRRDRRGSKN